MDDSVTPDSPVLFRQVAAIQKNAFESEALASSLTRLVTSCGSCRLKTICLSCGLEALEIDRLDAIIQRGRPLQPGEHLYRQGAPFKAVYAIRSGSLKAYRLGDDGSEQVAGFHFPGEIVGTDGIHGRIHHNSAQALETTGICEIPFEGLEELISAVPHLQRRFFQLLSQEIIDEQKLISLLSGSDADQRIVSLLLNLSRRNAERHLSATRFRLIMSRSDIGNYLGLRMETVSRVLSRLHQKGLIAIVGREVTLLEMGQLRAMAHQA